MDGLGKAIWMGHKFTRLLLPQPLCIFIRAAYYNIHGKAVESYECNEWSFIGEKKKKRKKVIGINFFVQNTHI